MKGFFTVPTVALILSLGACAIVPALAKPNTTPAQVQGRWVTTTTSATTYWNRDNGQFLGNASGNGQLYEFDARGNFVRYLVMEMRTGSLYTRARNDFKGTVTFTADTFTLHMTSGHYTTDTGSGTSGHPAEAADLKRLSQTYNWRMEKGDDGKPRFVVLFKDGSKQEYKQLLK